MDFRQFITDDATKTSGESADWAAWVSDNLANPLYNSSIVQTANTLSNALNTSTQSKLLGRLEYVEVAPPQTLVEEMAQSFSSAVGMIAPYAIAGKAAGAAMRSSNRTLALKGLATADSFAARAISSEITGQVVGAAFIDGFRDRKDGETALGNIAGGVAGFGFFGYGNHQLKAANLGLADRIVKRAAIGAVGSEMQLLASKTISGQQITDQELRMAALHGAVLNIGLPVVTDRILGPASDYLNTKLGRGISMERHATLNKLHGQSELLTGLMRENPLVRITKDPQAPAMADHRKLMISLNGEETPAGQLAHELAHISSARSNSGILTNPELPGELGFRKAQQLLSNGKYHDAKATYIETRHAQETYARRMQERVEVQIAEKNKGSVPENKPASVSAVDANRLHAAYNEKFSNEWNHFTASQGKFRPQVDYSLDVPSHTQLKENIERLNNILSEAGIESTGLFNTSNLPKWIGKFKPTGEVHQGNNAVVIMLEQLEGFPDCVLKILPQWDGQKPWEPVLFDKNGRPSSKPAGTFEDAAGSPYHLLLEELVDFDASRPGLDRLLSKIRRHGLEPSDPGSGPAYGWGSFSKKWVCADRDSLAPLDKGVHSVEQAYALTNEELSALENRSAEAGESQPTTILEQPLAMRMDISRRQRARQLFGDNEASITEIFDLVSDSDSNANMAYQTATYLSANGSSELAKQQVNFVIQLAKARGLGYQLSKWARKISDGN